MSNLHTLGAEEKRTDGEIRLLALPVRTALAVQRADAQLSEAFPGTSGSAGGAREVAKPLTTQILIEITHYKPLPAKTPITDIVAQRIYGYLYANGVEAGVAAKLWLEAADVVVSAEVTEVAHA